MGSGHRHSLRPSVPPGREAKRAPALTVGTAAVQQQRLRSLHARLLSLRGSKRSAHSQGAEAKSRRRLSALAAKSEARRGGRERARACVRLGRSDRPLCRSSLLLLLRLLLFRRWQKAVQPGVTSPWPIYGRLESCPSANLNVHLHQPDTRLHSTPPHPTLLPVLSTRLARALGSAANPHSCGQSKPGRARAPPALAEARLRYFAGVHAP